MGKLDDNIVKRIGGRILYVEPNSVNGHVPSTRPDWETPMTPDYNDMCISFNLICEVKTRYKTSGNGVMYDGKTATGSNSFTISFCSSPDDFKNAPKWMTVMGGMILPNPTHGYPNPAKENSLTTYYTDLDVEDFATRDIVEGLGVENITVAFETYYTPTATIKFVDTRGAALFGREEATHYNDKLTVDNVFGAFFTAPYPRFKLQIKGFFGKAVTYQLSCSNFKGSLHCCSTIL